MVYSRLQSTAVHVHSTKQEIGTGLLLDCKRFSAVLPPSWHYLECVFTSITSSYIQIVMKVGGVGGPFLCKLKNCTLLQLQINFSMICA